MKVCVFTGTRAEYGLLRPLLRRLEADPEVQLALLVSGAHFSDRHGRTVQEIEADGFAIARSVPLDIATETPQDVCRAMAQALEGCGAALAGIAPDLLVLLGDRYEALACACAAALHSIPVAHLYGGEITRGAVDELFRHAITKMSHVHFTSTEEYRARVIRMGEDPARVHNVGALGVEGIRTLPLLSLQELEADLGFRLGPQYLLATFHPVTLGSGGEEEALGFLGGLDAALARRPQLRILFTGANADHGGEAVDRLVRQFAARHPERVRLAASLGQTRYLSAMRHCAAVVGNSSSGIIEAPSFGVPTVNAGSRQEGRIRGAGTIDCAPTPGAVAEALERALSEGFAAVAKQARNPYEQSDTSGRMALAIKEWRGGPRKRFFDGTGPGCGEQA